MRACDRKSPDEKRGVAQFSLVARDAANSITTNVQRSPFFLHLFEPFARGIVFYRCEDVEGFAPKRQVDFRKFDGRRGVSAPRASFRNCPSRLLPVWFRLVVSSSRDDFFVDLASPSPSANRTRGSTIDPSSLFFFVPFYSFPRSVLIEPERRRVAHRLSALSQFETRR